MIPCEIHLESLPRGSAVQQDDTPVAGIHIPVTLSPMQLMVTYAGATHFWLLAVIRKVRWHHPWHQECAGHAWCPLQL